MCDMVVAESHRKPRFGSEWPNRVPISKSVPGRIRSHGPPSHCQSTKGTNEPITAPAQRTMPDVDSQNRPQLRAMHGMRRENPGLVVEIDGLQLPLYELAIHCEALHLKSSHTRPQILARASCQTRYKYLSLFPLLDFLKHNHTSPAQQRALRL